MQTQSINFGDDAFVIFGLCFAIAAAAAAARCSARQSQRMSFYYYACKVGRNLITNFIVMYFEYGLFLMQKTTLFRWSCFCCFVSAVCFHSVCVSLPASQWHWSKYILCILFRLDVTRWAVRIDISFLICSCFSPNSPLNFIFFWFFFHSKEFYNLLPKEMLFLSKVNHRL